MDPGGGREAYEVPDRCNWCLIAAMESELLTVRVVAWLSSSMFPGSTSFSPLTSITGATTSGISSLVILLSALEERSVESLKARVASCQSGRESLQWQ